MIVTSVQIKTVKTQKHLYCPVFTGRVFVQIANTLLFYFLVNLRQYSCRLRILYFFIFW